jgi:hypothetical protein
MLTFNILMLILVMIATINGEIEMDVEMSENHNFSMIHSIPDYRENSEKCSNQSSYCSPWVYCEESQCVCGHPPKTGSFNCRVGKNLSVLAMNCITYDKESDTFEAGKCFFNNHIGAFTKYPMSISEVDEFLCGRLFNRTGTLCGKCKDDHYPLAYSFDMNCVKCPNGKTNWWKYILAAYLPLTIFYLIVLTFKINVASSSLMYPFVAFAQGISFPINSRLMLTYMYITHQRSHETALRWIVMIYGIWNLDFFRSFNLGICLGIDPIQTLALDMAVGIYPLLLVLITYILVDLYDRNFTPIVFMWKPFQACFHFFQRKLDIRTTLIDVFCTIFFLSNAKLLSASTDLLVPVIVYQLNSTGHLGYSWRVFNDATLPYFGYEHLPYAIPAFTVLLVFSIFPVVLLSIYHFRWFQKFLNLFPIRWYILHTFVDSIQGGYKDGSEPGTRDCRWFASLIFTARNLMMLIGVSTFTTAYFPLATMVLAVVVILLVQFQPFKQSVSHLNHITTMFVSFLALCHIACLGTTVAGEHYTIVPFLVIVLVMVLLPLVYITVLILNWLYSNRGVGFTVLWRLKAWRQGYSTLQ